MVAIVKNHFATLKFNRIKRNKEKVHRKLMIK